MGSITLNTTAITDYGPQIFSAPAENIMLYALSISNRSSVWYPNSMHAVIGLLEGGETLEQLVAVLASGQTITQCAIGWTGAIPTGPDIRIFGLIMAPLSTQVLLSAYVLPYKVSAEGGIIVDP